MNEADREIWDELEELNPHYLSAIRNAMRVVVDRHKKYAVDGDPYFNFEHVALMMGVRPEQVFAYYRATKVSRLVAGGGDFDDESTLDTIVDLINYAALEYGYRLMRVEGEVVTELLDEGICAKLRGEP